MRWKESPPPKEGDWRINKRFLFKPLKLPLNDPSGPLETRWLEKPLIHQRFDSILGVWEDICWAYEPQDTDVGLTL